MMLILYHILLLLFLLLTPSEGGASFSPTITTFSKPNGNRILSSPTKNVRCSFYGYQKHYLSSIFRKTPKAYDIAAAEAAIRDAEQSLQLLKERRKRIGLSNVPDADIFASTVGGLTFGLISGVILDIILALEPSSVFDDYFIPPVVFAVIFAGTTRSWSQQDDSIAGKLTRFVFGMPVKRTITNITSFPGYIADAIQNELDLITQEVLSIPKKIKTAAKNKIDDTTNEVRNVVASTVEEIKATPKRVAESTKKTVVTTVDNTKTAIQTTATNTQMAVVTTVDNTKKAVVQSVKDTQTAIVTNVDNTKSAILKKVEDTKIGAKKKVEDTKAEAKKKVEDTKAEAKKKVEEVLVKILEKAA